MPTFHVYNDLIEPLLNGLLGHPALAGVQVFYDREPDEPVSTQLLPAIAFSIVPGGTDQARGSGASSMQTRRKTVPIGFYVMAAGANDAELDRELWAIVGELEDWLFTYRDFDKVKGIYRLDDMQNSPDYSKLDNGLVGSVLVQCTFEMFS